MEYNIDRNSNSLISIKPSQHNTKVAYIIHFFFLDIVDDIIDKIKDTPERYDVYATIPRYFPDTFYIKFFNNFPAGKLLHVDNIGRDILPWLKINKQSSFLMYDAVCKIHTKKSTHDIAHGKNVLKCLLQSLIKDEKTIKRNIDIVRSKRTMAGPHSLVTNINIPTTTNLSLIKKLISDDIISPERIEYVQGSMFWYHPSVMKPLLDLKIDESIFEKEPIQTDGFVPHAIERMFGWAVFKCNKKIHKLALQRGDIDYISYNRGRVNYTPHRNIVDINGCEYNIPSDFDWETYIQKNPFLCEINVNTRIDAIVHYCVIGKNLNLEY